MTIEIRKDCPWFEPKRWVSDCKDCQTDGHYLCAGCRYIAPFEQMEESDNRMRYYPNEEKQRQADELEESMQDEDENSVCGDCGWVQFGNTECESCDSKNLKPLNP